MTYPQPSSNSPALNGQKYLRLNAPLVSPGDIYQSEQSGLAFAVGPESDIARVNLNYYDDQVANKLNQISISNRAPFVGLIQARTTDKYPISSVPGRILFSSGDIVPDLRLSQYYPNTTSMMIPPVMDVVQYFAPPSSGLYPGRNDRNYYFQDFPVSTTFNLFVPYYGRAWGQIQVRDPGAIGVTLAIIGINWGLGINSNNVKTLRGAAAIGAGVNQIIESTVDGDFDYIELQFAAGNGVDKLPTRILFSDVPR